MANAPTESKVWGSTVGTGAGATISALLLWVAGVFIWGVAGDAASAGAAIAAVPLPVAGFVSGLVTVGGAYLGGWLAKHTPRPELEYQPKRELVEDAVSGDKYGNDYGANDGQTWDESPENQEENYVAPEYAPADVDYVESDER